MIEVETIVCGESQEVKEYLQTKYNFVERSPELEAGPENANFNGIGGDTIEKQIDRIADRERPVGLISFLKKETTGSQINLTIEKIWIYIRLGD